jgi:hypothetical protein
LVNWAAYFQQNRITHTEIPWDRGIKVPPQLRLPLIRSLQRFQMGERGEGEHLKKVSSDSGDPRYVAAIALFVEEEQRHAALMAGVLRSLGAPLIRDHWTNKCFRLICSMSGLYVELPVLLVAEIIAKRYFRLLHESMTDPVLRAVCAQIRHDEEGHIAFHTDTLRPKFSILPIFLRYLLRIAWRLFFAAVCMIVAYDHRRLLRAAGVSPTEFFRSCLCLFDATSRIVFTPGYTGVAPGDSQTPAINKIPVTQRGAEV